MAIEQLTANGFIKDPPARREHLLDVLEAASLGQGNLLFLDNGIDGTPRKLSYASLFDEAKVCHTHHARIVQAA